VLIKLTPFVRGLPLLKEQSLKRGGKLLRNSCRLWKIYYIHGICTRICHFALIRVMDRSRRRIRGSWRTACDPYWACVVYFADGTATVQIFSRKNTVESRVRRNWKISDAYVATRKRSSAIWSAEVRSSPHIEVLRTANARDRCVATPIRAHVWTLFTIHGLAIYRNICIRERYSDLARGSDDGCANRETFITSIFRESARGEREKNALADFERN